MRYKKVDTFTFKDRPERQFRVYPEGFDPNVAAGPPDRHSISELDTWTPEDTEAMKALAKKAKIISSHAEPNGRWYEEIK